MSAQVLVPEHVDDPSDFQVAPAVQPMTPIPASSPSPNKQQRRLQRKENAFLRRPTEENQVRIVCSALDKPLAQPSPLFIQGSYTEAFIHEKAVPCA